MDTRKIVILLSLVVIVVFGGVFLYDAVLGETEEASGPILAIPLEVETVTKESGEAETGSETTVDSSVTQTESSTDNGVMESTPSGGGLTLFSISQENSEASFMLSEVLRGSPTTVVGTTDQVAGEVAVDLNDLSSTQVGTIQINARTLVTDENRRNQAIRNRILNTDRYEFITFVPTEIIGLDGSVTSEQELTFQIVGDLTIRDVTQQVNFDVAAQVDGDGRLVGTAAATINRADFELNIPSVPFVADVGEEVTLALNFTAPAVS